jgi:hypothetical protein
MYKKISLSLIIMQVRVRGLFGRKLSGWFCFSSTLGITPPFIALQIPYNGRYPVGKWIWRYER